MEFESIKRNHTNTIVNLLSEKNLNERNYLQLRLYRTKAVLEELEYRVFNLNYRYHYKSLSSIVDLISQNIVFINLLKSYDKNGFPQVNHLKSGIEKLEEMKKLGDLIRNLDLSNENLTMAFHNLKIDEVYKSRIVKVSKFTLNRRSKLFYDFRSTITMYYDIFLPFHDKNYDETSTNCTNIHGVPLFFFN